MYEQTVGYDAFSNMGRTTTYWDTSGAMTGTYVNGRKTSSPAPTYDAAGNITFVRQSDYSMQTTTYDAAGRPTKITEPWRLTSPQLTVEDTTAEDFDGDGRTVKRVDNKSSTQLPSNTTTTSETTEYYVGSTVLGKILTELDSNGGKKVTKVYTGEGILAEQRNFPADANHSQAWSEVFWKHEDLVTGSYSKIIRNGTALNTYDPPSKAELEPLGGKIPETDPNIDTDLAVPSGLRQFKFAGDVNRPELGCEYNGGPIPCNLLSVALRGRTNYRVGIRYQGDESGGAWGLRQSLQTNVSVWRYNVRQVVDNEDERLTPELFKDKEVLKDIGNGKFGLLVGSFYVAYLSQFAETLISHSQQQTQTPHGPSAPTKPDPGPCEIVWQLPSNGVGFFAKGGTSRDRQIGNLYTLNHLIEFAQSWVGQEPNPSLRIGEISVLYGGQFGEHKGEGHKFGIGVDIGLFNTAGTDLGGISVYNDSRFDANTTYDLINHLLADSNVAFVMFGDKNFKSASSKYRYDPSKTHRNHVHVVFDTPCHKPVL